MGNPAYQLPKIDFSGADPTEPGSPTWSAVRARVTDALTTTGCFEAAYPPITPDLRNSLFNTALKHLFSLPLQTKIKNVSDLPFHTYLGRIPNDSIGKIPDQPNYESLSVIDAQLPGEIQSFTHLMWPDHGNPNFCETVQGYAKRLVELERVVVRMVMESFGAGGFYESDMLGSTRYSFRMSEYTAVPEGGAEEKDYGIRPHTDTSIAAIISQNGVDGLEIETRDGDWVPVVPSPGSFIVLAGDALQAWTNGRVCSAMHRVVVRGNETRYSTILFSFPNNDTMIRAPPELVDADHPPCFEPYDYMSYVNFCITEKGLKAKPRLQAFCGLVNQQQAN